MDFNNFGSSVKLNNIKAYGDVNTATNDAFKKQIYSDIEEIDYGSYGDIDSNLSSVEENKSIDWGINYTADKGLNKLKDNIVFYGLSDGVKEGLKAVGVKSSIVTVLITTGAKFISTGEISLEAIRDDVLAGGTFKKTMTETVNNLFVKKIESNILNSILKQSGIPPMKSDALEKIIATASKIKDPDIFEKAISNNLFSNFAKTQLASLGTGTIVDYTASVAVNCIVGFVNGDGLTLEEAKLGTTLLKSTWKTIGSKAFETIGFAVLGPKGKIIGKTFGTVVGATFGDFVVNAFDNDENWCAIAGAATIAGSVAVAGVFTGLIACGAITCSIPVAGWIVGGAMIVGGLIGSGITWLVYKCSGG